MRKVDAVHTIVTPFFFLFLSLLCVHQRNYSHVSDANYALTVCFRPPVPS